jgi:type I restriction enzyme S subunit
MKWQSVTLESIFEIERGGSPRPIQEYLTEDEDGVNWIMISDASNSSKYIKTIKKKIRKDGVKKSRMVYSGDLLLTNSMSFGHPYIMQNTGCIHDGWLVLRKKNKDIHLEYFYYLLGSGLIYSEFKNLAAGATVKNLNVQLVKNVSIPLPPFDDQIRIATLLSRAESLKSRYSQSLTTIETLYSSLSQRAFKGDLDLSRVINV